MAVDAVSFGTHTPAQHVQAEPFRARANRMGLWLFIGSETCLFAAALAARFYVSGFDRPEHLNQTLALAITGVLLVSSLTAYRAEASIASGDRRGLIRNLVATLAMGAVFMVGVVFEWEEAIEYFPPETIFGSSFFLLIGLHAFHVVTGLVILGLCLNLARLGRFDAEDHWMVEVGVKYWHFVDVAWVFVFPTLYLVS